MNKYSVGEIIEMAVQTERLGYQFYTEMAERFKDDQKLSELCGTLALKEKSHEAVFRKLKETAGAEEIEGPEEFGQYMRAMVESEFFIGKEKSLPSLEHVTSADKAVDFALGFEKETLLYFIGLRSMLNDTTAIDGIINEERSHIAWLSRFRVER